jgi:integrase
MKHQNGFGSIICLDKTGKKRRKPYAVRITTGWKDGRQQRKYLGYYKSEKEALMALAEYHKNGVDLDLTKLTLNEVYDRWIERVDKKGLSESRMRTHLMARKRFEQLGNKRIKDIKTPHLQDWLDGLDMKPGSKGIVRTTLVQLYSYAVTNDIVQRNYAQGLEINEKTESTGKVFTPDEIEILWKHTNDADVQKILILIYTGMRVGEMLDIHKDNIHLDEGYMIGGNKTEAGKDRIIPLHDKIKPFVKEQLGDNKWLTTNAHGEKLSYTTMRRNYVKVMKQFGMDHKVHDTRKTAVSIMHSSGIPMETVRMIVGHSGKGVTEKVYLFKDAHELVEVINTLEIPY